MHSIPASSLVFPRRKRQGLSHRRRQTAVRKHLSSCFHGCLPLVFLRWALSFLPMRGLHFVVLICDTSHSLKLSDSTPWRSKLERVLTDLPCSASSFKLSAALREIEKCRHLCWVPNPESVLWPTPACSAPVIGRLKIKG